LREGEDYPYFETSGFPENFVRLENNLCTRNERGEIVRDAHSNPVPDCMCGNILQGRFDPARSFFTGGGSFWSSHTTQLLATTTDADRQARTRNRCTTAGYESVALVPLRSGGETFGLIQLNDKRQGLFNAEKIALLERLADNVAGFLAKTQAEENLRQSEEKFRLIFETSPDAISITRLDDGLFLDVNQGYLALTGLGRAEVIGKTAQEIKVWEDPAGRDRLVERLRSHGKAHNQETRFFAKDGGLRTVLVSAVAITLDGEPCLLSIIRDIEDLKRSQSELRLWADAFTYCAHGMAIGLPADNIFLAANPAFARMLGRQVDDIVGRPIPSIYDPADWANLRQYMAEVERIALVVMDLGMPGMGGHKCLKEMLALRPEAKVVIASGYSANGQVKASLEAGAAGYVAKPFRRADLLATVRSVLDGKPAPKA
jgi:PAS domain S-box-containing protein